MRTIAMLFLTGALMLAYAAERHSVRLFQPAFVGQTELRPGDYQLTLDGNRAVFKKRGGQETAEAEVKVESSDRKYPSTAVLYDTTGGKYKVSEIRLGGTRTKLIFN